MPFDTRNLVTSYDPTRQREGASSAYAGMMTPARERLRGLQEARQASWRTPVTPGPNPSLNPADSAALARAIAGPTYDTRALGVPSPQSGNILAGIPAPMQVERGRMAPPVPMFGGGGQPHNILADQPGIVGKVRQTIPPQPVPNPRYV